MKQWETNKACFVVDEETLYKTYFRAGNAYKDGRLLEKIQAEYKQSEIDAWTYKPLKIYSYSKDDNTLVTEFLPGKTLDVLYREESDPSVFAHQGIWLGILHTSTVHRSRVLSFNDFNRNNVIIDSENKQVVAIDPGHYESVYADPGISLIAGALSILRGCLFSGIKSSVKSIYHFIAGYLKSAPFAGLPPLTPGLKYGYKRIVNKQYRSPFIHKPGLHLHAAAEISLLYILIKLIELYVRHAV